MLFRYCLPTFESIGLSIQGKKRKIYNFKLGAMAPSYISDRNILNTFDLQVASILSTKFLVCWSSVQKTKRKYIFKMATMVAILHFLIRTI